ncbi:nucleotidyl transferase AbiEii/AbiGii toxin family protein [Streptomyces sp. MMBL 11-3]|uniref:nucleotidyl transferase AbiEii/AbiGii toxin family protein n=1 Tax=Streptomyces sp. MMBL 11-3 TaxID=3382639 RepID=UPI0039B5B5CD
MKDLPELHARLPADVIALGAPYPLVLTGGYAVRAPRLSQDLDVATENPARRGRHRGRGRGQTGAAKVAGAGTGDGPPLSARFTVSDPATGQEYEVDILKENFRHPITHTAYGPVLAEEDVIGTKAPALTDRGAPRDLIDVFAAAQRWTTADL